MSYDDICKLIAIKQAQDKMDMEMRIAKDFLIKGKNHKSWPCFKKSKTIVIHI